MKDNAKTQGQLIKELAQLRRRIAELEQSELEHKHDKQALKTNNERLQYLLTSTSAAIYTSKTSGDYGATSITENVKQMTGYEPREFIENSSFWLDNVHPEDRQRIVNELPVIFKKGKHTYEYRFRHKDGHYIYIHDDMKLIKDKFKNPIEIIGYWVDITERKLADQALRESEEKYRNLAERSNDGIGIGQDGRICYANQRLAQIGGYTVKELIGVSILDFFMPDEVSKVFDHYKRRMAGEDIMTVYESALRHKDGSRIAVEINAGIIDYQGKPADLVLVRDITERKQTERELRESEERFRLAFENANAGVCLVDLDGNLARVNSKMCEIFGYTKEELERMTVNDIAFPDDIDKSPEFIQKTLRGDIDRDTFEKRYFHKKGHVVTCQLSSSLVRDAEGAPLYFITHLHDITERKQTEEALREKQETINAIIETSQDWIWAIDRQGVRTFSNPAIEKILGYRTEEIVGSASLNLMHEDDKKMVGSIIQECEEKRCGWNNLLLRWRHKNGTYQYLESNAVPIIDSKGDLVGFRGVDRDITERKHAEEEISSLAKFPAENPNPVLRVRQDGTILYANKASQVLLEDWGASVGSPATPFLQEMATQTFASQSQNRIEVTCKDHIYSFVVAPITDTGYINLYGRDITERRSLQEMLNKEREELRLIIDSSPIIVFYKDKDGRFIRVNKLFAEALKMSEEDFVGKTVFDLYSPKIAQGMTDDDQEVLQSRLPKLNIIEQYVSASGTRWVQTDKIPICDNHGMAIGLIGFAQDITERKQAEEALREAEARIRTLFEAIPDSILVHDEKGTILHVNEIGAQRLEWSVKELVGRNLREIVTPENAASIADHVRETHTVGWSRFETTFVARSGWKIIAEVNERPITFGTGKAILSVARDITDRKQAEKKLRESEERYKTLFDEALVGICLADAETGIIIDCNEALAALVCRERAELIGRPQKILHPPQDNKEAFSPTFKQHLTNKKGLILETQVVTRTGDIREVEIKANLLDLQGRKVLQGLFHDITESKRAEKELCESEEKFRLAFENANTGVCLVDIAGNLTKVNNSMCETFGYTKEELERMTVNDIAHPDDIDASPTFIQETLEGKIDRGTFQKRYIHKKGHVVTCQVSSSLVRDANGSPLYFISHVHDITDRKRAEEQLSSSYQQAREMLVTTVNALASTVEMKDQYTAGHQPRSTQLACAIAEEMGLPHDQIEAIRMACSIHDIGKLVVPAEILNKPGPLTAIQYEMVKMHPNAGYDIVKRIKFPWPVAEIIRQHHEYMNGSGYPQGLTGEKIMLEARVLTVANVVEAMTSHRPYRAAHDIKEALEEITKNKGILYDPGVVDACLRLFKEKGFALDALTQAANSPPGR